ncbi:MAG: hypothetical protein WCG87_05205 [Bacteroidota bacterium]
MQGRCTDDAQIMQADAQIMQADAQIMQGKCKILTKSFLIFKK